MIIIGCDYHPGVQQIAFVDTETGEFQETRLQHREPAEQFYRELALRGVQVRLGMEASGQARWFERTASRTADGGVDRRCRRNSSAASPQEEDRSGGCSTYSALAGGGSVSTDLDAELGESRCAAVAVAPASDGADAHASDEPVASGGTE